MNFDKNVNNLVLAKRVLSRVKAFLLSKIKSEKYWNFIKLTWLEPAIQWKTCTWDLTKIFSKFLAANNLTCCPNSCGDFEMSAHKNLLREISQIQIS